MPTFNELIDELCKEKEIKVTSISMDWIKVLEKDNKIHYIISHKFDLNSNSVSTILDDKYAFFELMEFKKNPIIKHHIIFRNYSHDYIKKLYELYNHNLVIKANIGSCGKEVFHEKNLKKIYSLLDKLLIKNYSLSICPYINIKNEYRVIILDEKILLIYGKIKPVVYGDGKKTLSELLIEFNPHYFKDKKDISDIILNNGEKYEYNWQFNLSKGANLFVDIDNSLEKRLSDLALKVARDANIRFCSIDIILDEENKLYLMEANSGVMLDNFMNIHPNGINIAKFIYGSAINKMFEK